MPFISKILLLKYFSGLNEDKIEEKY